MSAAAAEPIRTPDRLDLPDGLRSLAEGLPAGARTRLAGELLEALEVARSTGDLAAVQSTVRRWQDFAARVREAREEAARRMARNEPEARRLVAGLRGGETPDALGLVEGGLERVMTERGIGTA